MLPKSFIGHAVASTKIGEFTASGFLFKDSVELVTVEDPEGMHFRILFLWFRSAVMNGLAHGIFS